jgi:ribosomal-protein-alanine N-acetyltransferase
MAPVSFVQDQTSPHLETARLRLTPVTAADVAELHALWTTPEVREFFWDGEIIPLDRTTSIATESTRLFATRGFGLWAARLCGEAGLAAFGGLWYFRDPPELELLYGVGAEHWRRGLATEIAGAVTSYAFQDLGHQVIRASTDAGNTASVRVLEKLGFALERRVLAGGLDTLFYQLHRSAEHQA